MMPRVFVQPRAYCGQLRPSFGRPPLGLRSRIVGPLGRPSIDALVPQTHPVSVCPKYATRALLAYTHAYTLRHVEIDAAMQVCVCAYCVYVCTDREADICIYIYIE